MKLYVIFMSLYFTFFVYRTLKVYYNIYRKRGEKQCMKTLTSCYKYSYFSILFITDYILKILEYTLFYVKVFTNDI